MRERLVTLALALAALGVFLVMFVRGDGPIETRREVPRPTTAEQRGNGYYALVSWLEAEGIRTISLRDRFDTLPQREGLPATGNLLIVTLPAIEHFETQEFRPLDQWVRAGNTLLVMAALSDNPDWAFARGGLIPGDLNLLTGLQFETVRSRERREKRQAGDRSGAGASSDDESEAVLVETFRAFAEPRRSVLVPNRPHAYFVGVHEAVALSDYPPQAWTVRVPYEGFVLSLAHQKQTGEGVLWTRPLGKGRIIVSGFGSLFTNRAIGLADNGRLFANLIGANLGPDGVVLFDDLHQGLGATYDPDSFYQDRRLYITIAIVMALWLAWVLGSTRLRTPVLQEPAPSEAELVRASGSFLARVLREDAAARRLMEHFFARITRRASLQGGADAPWEILERHPRIVRADLDQLKKWHADACAGRRVPLVPLHNLLVRIDRQIA